MTDTDMYDVLEREQKERSLWGGNTKEEAVMNKWEKIQRELR